MLQGALFFAAVFTCCLLADYPELQRQVLTAAVSKAVALMPPGFETAATLTPFRVWLLPQDTSVTDRHGSGEQGDGGVAAYTWAFGLAATAALLHMTLAARLAGDAEAAAGDNATEAKMAPGAAGNDAETQEQWQRERRPKQTYPQWLIVMAALCAGLMMLARRAIAGATTLGRQ